MKRPQKNVEEFVLRHLGLFKAPQEEMDLAEARIRERLHSTPLGSGEETSLDFGANRRTWKIKFALAFAAATLAVVMIAYLRTPQPVDAHAIVVSADGSLSRIAGDTVQTVRNGERVEAGQRLHTNDANGSITLADGSRVETRSQSEFSVERAADGIRIHLFKGRLIVKAARQVAGHLYVQTKDVIVSVVGTVFLVNAEEEGSRVAVIEGEVRVQQGAIEKSLRKGEQLATNPSMEPLAVKEEASWSQSVEIQMAILQQPAAPPKPVEAPEVFDVASIRASAPLQITGRGGPPGAAARPPALNPEIEQAMARNQACGGAPSQLDVTPGRLAVTSATVYRLIALAYGTRDCALAIQFGLIAGGPGWAKSDRFDIQATIPEGSPVYTRQQLTSGDAAKLQLMIQHLLESRFRLELRREMKDIQGFNLVVAKAGKIRVSEDQTPPAPYDASQGFRSSNLPRGVMLNCVGNGIAISSIANCLQRMVAGPIIDKTDLKGLYDIPQAANPDPSSPMSEAFRASQTLEQIGLKLEPTKVQRETLMIERVEKPSEN